MCMCVYVYIDMHAYYKSIREEACFPPWKQEKIIEVPQVQVVEKIVEVPQKQAGGTAHSLTAGRWEMARVEGLPPWDGWAYLISHALNIAHVCPK